MLLEEEAIYLRPLISSRHPRFSWTGLYCILYTDAFYSTGGTKPTFDTRQNRHLDPALDPEGGHVKNRRGKPLLTSYGKTEHSYK